MENKHPTSVAELISLKSPQQFLLLKQKGKRHLVVPWLVVYSRPNQQNQIRLGFTLPRYVGNAVTRNRLRRWCREYLRHWAEQVPEGKTMDLSVVFRRQAPDFYKQMSHQEIDQVLARSLKNVA